VAAVPVFTFEVLPMRGRGVDAFLIDVPSLSGEEYAARRAYWSAFHILGPQGLDPEDFTVRAYSEDAEPYSGRLVGPGGFIDPSNTESR
jgi:hypothetical protein